MTDYFSNYFPQSTYRRTDDEHAGKDIRKVEMSLPDLSASPDDTKEALRQRVSDMVNEVVEALGIGPRVPEPIRQTIHGNVILKLGIHQ